MNAQIKQMSFSELYAMMEVIASEIEHRKEQAVSDYKQALAQLAEMGIDPATIAIDPTDSVENKEQPTLTAESETAEQVPTDDSMDDTTYETENEIVVAAPEPEEENDDCAASEETDSCSKTGRFRLLKPFYKIWKELSARKEKPVKEDTTGADVPKQKRVVNKLLIPFYKLFTDKPIKQILRLGNLKCKESFKDPEMTRIASADGISPTLTATHSDFYIWIGPNPKTGGGVLHEAA